MAVSVEETIPSGGRLQMNDVRARYAAAIAERVNDVGLPPLEQRADNPIYAR